MMHPTASNCLKNETYREKGFATLGLAIEEEQILNCYRLLDESHAWIRNHGEASIEHFDEEIAKYLEQKNFPIPNIRKASAPIFLRNIDKDSSKYRHLSSSETKHETCSYHYTDGLYEHLMHACPNLSLGPLWPFFQQMATLHNSIASYLQPLIQKVDQSVRCITTMKVWRYSPAPLNGLLLPIHHDLSIFTVAIHTKNPSKECLAIFPQGEKGSHRTPYPLSSKEFPLLFPGGHAIDHFNLSPTTHSVLSRKEDHKKFRYSLILFIGRTLDEMGKKTL